MFRIVHLSDLHAAEASQWSFMPLLNAAREVLLNESRQGNFDVFAFTGDVAFSGKPSEYDIAAQWIENLCLSPTGLNLDQDRILFVPGNHDVDRSLIPPNATAIEDALARARSQDEIARFYNHRDSLNLLLQRHKAYAAFCERIRGDSSLSLPSWTQRFDFGDYSIGFEGFSTSWLCRGADDHGRLLIGQPQVAERLMQRQNCDLLIALTHHPTSDLMDFDATNFQEHLRAHYDVLLRGHLHRPDAIGYSTATGDYLEIAAGALYERHNTPNRFNIIDVSDNLEEIHVRTYEWSRNQWILDRNLYPNSPDGVFRTTLKPPRSPAAPANQEHSTPAAPIVELPNVSAHPAPEVPSDGASKLPAPETSERPPNYLQSFPRFAADIRAEDLAVRQSQLEEALLAMESRRLVEIAAEWGTNPMSFIRALVRKMKHSYEPLTLLHTRCSGAATGPQLQTSLIVHSQLSATEFGAQLNTLGKTLLILDDVSLSGDQPSGEASVRDTITAFLDYCPDLFVLALSEGSHGAQSPSPHAIHLCPLDAADTRAYMTARQAKAVQFDSVVDYDRVHKATGGLPMHIDNLLDAMAYTDLNGALLGLTSPQSEESTNIPERIATDISTLATALDDDSTRAYTMLTVLCVLEQGESLNMLRRIEPQSPLWPKHAKVLEELGLLDVIDSSHTNADPLDRIVRRDKILRVPRVVRDFVLPTIPPSKRQELIAAAASLYFGSDWKSGALRVRSRPSAPNQLTTAESCNEIGIVRTILLEAESSTAVCTSHEAVTLALKYLRHLHSKGLYGEGYEAARDALGIIENSPSLGHFIAEITELQLFAGKCARMIGERTASVTLLNAALPAAKDSGVNERIQDILISLALVNDSLGNKYEAIDAANKVLQTASNNSGDYLQAKAIIAGHEEAPDERRRLLTDIARRARNHRHYVVADNIALDLAERSTNVEEVLQHLALVRSRHEREYNYVRATIRRVETLIKADRLREITDLDRYDLSRSYSMCHTQRLGGVFEWCHRVMWDYLEKTGNRDKLRELFMHSSFMWRLKGDTQSEIEYAKRMESSHDYSVPGLGGAIAAFIRYCNARIRTLLTSG